MGQKINPIGFRLGVTNTWDSIWFAPKKQYIDNLHADLKIRKIIKERFQKGGVVKVKVERYTDRINVAIHTAKPGVIIGKKGESIEALKAYLKKNIDPNIHISIVEVKKTETVAENIAENVAMQLEQRMPFRRVMKQAIRSAMRGGVKGIKIMISGRLNGADMARTEQYKEGRVPLHTLKAKIDYTHREALTTYGKIGVKVWVYNGDQTFKKESEEEEDKYEVKRRAN